MQPVHAHDARSNHVSGDGRLAHCFATVRVSVSESALAPPAGGNVLNEPSVLCQSIGPRLHRVAGPIARSTFSCHPTVRRGSAQALLSATGRVDEIVFASIARPGRRS